MSDPRHHDVDELRQRLRSLGYLDAGVDRFVLGAARVERRPAAIAWLAAVRIGAIAAALLGPLAAVGIATRMPGLVTGPRDAFVVAAYSGLVFGAAGLLGSALMIMAAAALGARGRSGTVRRAPAVVAGAVVTIAVLAYLTLWWDASALAAGPRSILSSGSWATIVALALSAAISLLLGHAVTVSTLAVTVARTGANGSDVRGVPGASRRMTLASGVLAFCAALLLFNLTRAFESIDTAPDRLTVVSSGLRVRVIAIDGFDAAVAQRLAAAGRIPALAAALDSTRATLQIGDASDPARTWTTVATAQPADVHAVRTLETRRVAGVDGALAADAQSPLGRAIAATTDLVRLTRPAVASGQGRRAKTFWEVAASAGLRTVAVNWWATWPAPPDAGIVVSDRGALRLEHGGQLDAEIAPPAAYDALRQRWPALREEASRRARELPGGDAAAERLKRPAELDLLHLALTREITTRDTDLTCIYLPGLDLVQHALLSPAGGNASPATTVADRLLALDEYYVFLDGLLADVLRPAADELVVLLASPGRVPAPAQGLIAIRGQGANARVRDAMGRATDVMPTVLYALGLPVSREVAGRPLIELFSAEFAKRYPVREVSTYGRPGVTHSPRGGEPLDEEAIDRLRSLGYIR